MVIADVSDSDCWWVNMMRWDDALWVGCGAGCKGDEFSGVGGVGQGRSVFWMLGARCGVLFVFSPS